MGDGGGALVGRGRERAALEAALDAVEAGTCRFLLVSGDPGLGKTRLLQELADQAERRGFAVSAARSLDEVGAEPYALLAEAVEPVVGEHLTDWLTEAPRSAGAEEARAAFFERLAASLSESATDAPLVLVLDDLQWSDTPSLRFLDHVAGATLRGVLVTIGHRGDAARPDGELGELVPCLREVAGTVTIELGALPDDDIVEIAELAAGRSLVEVERSEVLAEAQGNPLFAQEIARALTPAADAPGPRVPAVPGAVRASIAIRVQGLPEDAAETMRAAAVLGAEFDVESVAIVLGRSADSVLRDLEPAEQVGLVARARRPGHLAFGHPLIWRLVYDGLTARERALLHLRAAEALAGARAGGGEEHLAAVAFHYGRAASVGGADLAVAHHRRAGDHAVAHLAFEDAVRFYGEALDLAGRGGELTPADRVELMLRRAEALIHAGATLDGRAQFAEAAAAAEVLGDGDRLARGALGRAGYRGTPGAPDVEAIGLLERSLTMAPTDQLLVAQVAARQAMELYYLGERERRDRLSADAVAAARSAGDDRVLAQVLISRHYAIDEVANVVERTAVAAEAARLAEANGDPDTAMRAHYLLVRDHLEVGDRAGADRAADRLRVLAADAREPLHPWRVLLVDALFADLDGDLAVADRLTDEALVAGTAAAIPNAAPAHLGMTFLVRSEQGRLGELVEALAASHAAYPIYSTWGPMLAWAQLEAGERRLAQETFDRAMAGLADITEDEAFLATGYALGAVAVALADRSAAQAVYDRYVAFGDRVVVVVGPTGCTGPLALVLARLAMTLGHNHDAANHLDEAAAKADRLRSPRWRARVGEVRAALDRRGRAHPAGLTDREVEVLRLLVAGRTNREMAAELGVGVRTVDSHVSTIYRKVGARGRVEAVSFALAHGVTPDDP